MWDRTLRTSGCTGLDIEVKDCEDPHYVMSTMMTTATALVSPYFDWEILIVPLGDNAPNLINDDLRLRLSTQTKRKVSIESLEHTEADGKICLFIDCADSVLARLDATQFENTRRLLTTSSHTIWVFRHASGPCEAPFAALHTGFLRTLRCENSQTSYISLDIDHRRQSWTQFCLDTMVEVFTTVFDTIHKRFQKDNEFSERSGVVRLSRIMENDIESKAITDDLAIEEQPFFQDLLELRLDAQSPGMLGSLAFIDASGQSEVLPSNSVKIKSMAF